MSNPLLSMMGNSMPANNPMTNIGSIVRMLRSSNPEQIAQKLMQQNPQFRSFIQANQGKSPEQVAKEHGIDFNQIMSRFR